MPNITEITKKKVTCIYVVSGIEVMRREEENHPGMDIIKVKWDQEDKLPNSMIPRIRKSTCQGEFYWDHIDAKGNHVFMCHNPSNILIEYEIPKNT